MLEIARFFWEDPSFSGELLNFRAENLGLFEWEDVQKQSQPFGGGKIPTGGFSKTFRR